MNKASQENDKGNEYFKARKFEESIVSFSNAITVCDADQQLLSIFFSNRALANLKLKRYFSAIDDATQSFLLDKKYCKPLYYRYMARKALGELNEAFIDITAVCFLENEEIEKHVNARDELMYELVAKKTEEFIRNLPRISVKANDDIVEEYFKHFKMHALFDQSYNAEKLNLFLQNLAIAPKVENRDAKIYLTKAIICFLNADWILAEKFANEAIRHVKNDVKLKITAMITLANTRMFPENRMQFTSISNILKIFDDALLLDKDNVDIYLHRAICYFLFKLYDQGFSDSQRCVVMDPTFEEASILMFNARYYMNVGKNPKAVKKMFTHFEEYVRDHPNSVDAPIEYSKLLYHSGETGKAVDVISKALEHNPANCLLLKEMAEYLAIQDPPTSRPFLLKALNSGSLFKSEVFLLLAFVAAHQGDFNEALIYSNKAISLIRNERSFLRGICRKEIVSSTVLACNLLGLNTSIANGFTFIKQLAPVKAKIYSFRQSMFSE
ncbi:Mitochondrial import receptor subunit TOM70-like protein [Leptotrombidium deliense]|uniref:Mitochondrial import receptor subunit TOM70-like protein n=1 Tax=Leptotrombidium deliense TaxID=299467 RepID=A0A443S4W7_9ACAR|nr:Mitochondrial import receptor subunit TOM70-like protein [Leptotrombidium deliense]